MDGWVNGDVLYGRKVNDDLGIFGTGTIRSTPCFPLLIWSVHV